MLSYEITKNKDPKFIELEVRCRTEVTWGAHFIGHVT